MLYKHFTEKLLGLQDIEIEKIEEIDNSIHIFCHLKRKSHKCPRCDNRCVSDNDFAKGVKGVLDMFPVIFCAGHRNSPFPPKRIVHG